MHGPTPLLSTLTAGLIAAFAMGAVAHRLRISPVAGYLLAGVLLGPFTPGYVADSGIARELAEIGIVLLMFGAGLHFSPKDLLAVRRIALPGAIAQMTTATLLGLALARLMGWSLGAGLVFGLSLSVASTVVVVRALEVRNLLNTERGRIAVGWLIVEDVAMVVALVLLPAIAEIDGTGDYTLSSVVVPLAVAAAKVAAFAAIIFLIGARIVPALLSWAARTGSREMFRLAVLTIALGVAFGAASLFDVSFALGAFLAGTILGETRLSQRAGEDILPLRDAFAVLFFVSAGMLFNPATIVEKPWPLLASVSIIILGKSLAALAILRAFGHSGHTASTVAAGLAQIGEFSFILAGFGVSLALLPAEARDLILASAIISILLHPFVFSFATRRRTPLKDGEEPSGKPPRRHTILVGYGRVGRLVAAELRARGHDFVIVEEQRDVAGLASHDGFRVVIGNAASPGVLEKAEIADADKLLIAIPEGFEAGRIAELAINLGQNLTVIARAHSDEEVAHLDRRGAHHVIMGEREIAAKMAEFAAGTGLHRPKASEPAPAAAEGGDAVRR